MFQELWDCRRMRFCREIFRFRDRIFNKFLRDSRDYAEKILKNYSRNLGIAAKMVFGDSPIISRLIKVQRQGL